MTVEVTRSRSPGSATLLAQGRIGRSLVNAFPGAGEARIARTGGGNAGMSAVRTINHWRGHPVIAPALTSGTTGQGGHDAKSIFPAALTISALEFRIRIDPFRLKFHSRFIQDCDRLGRDGGSGNRRSPIALQTGSHLPAAGYSDSILNRAIRAPSGGKNPGGPFERQSHSISHSLTHRGAGAMSILGIELFAQGLIGEVEILRGDKNLLRVADSPLAGAANGG